ncbi:MAG: HD domain-containing phosphohydrolase [Betaproteobacteria bacterium]
MSRPPRPSPPRSTSALGAYVWTVALTGALVLVVSAVRLPTAPRPGLWSLFAGLAIAAGSFTLRIAPVSATISVSDTFFIASAVLFGPAPATLAVAVASCIVSIRRGHPWQRVAFNTSAPALSMWVAGATYFAITGLPPGAVAPQPIGSVPIPLVCLTAIYFVLNSGLTAVAIGLDVGEAPHRIWRQHFLWLSINYLAACSVAFCVVLLIEQVSLAAAAMMLPVLVILQLALRASFGRLEDATRHVADVDRLYRSTVETLAMAIDAKDDVTHSHVRRVQAYAVGLARALGVTDEPSIKALEAAALLHDTGKLAVPEHILNKPGRLTGAEFETMKRHVEVGADILSLVDFPYPVVPIVRCHHESWDGSGYPRGVSREEIPLGARILSVVDCFDALTSDRPYRARLSDEAALDILKARRGTMYDPCVVDTFVRIYRDIPLADEDASRHRDVLQAIGRARPIVHAPAPPAPAPAAASNEVLAFVSLARLTSGSASPADVFALASRLLDAMLPGVTVAWYLLDPECDHLTVAEASGPAAHHFRGTTMRVGERLTGWVAANRSSIVNSDAALDIASTDPPLASCLGTPLANGDTLAGVLTLYSPRPDGFTSDVARLVEMIAPHVAQAVVRTRRNEPADTQTPAAKPAPRDLRLVSTR